MKASFTVLVIGLDGSGKSSFIQSTKDDLVFSSLNQNILN